MIRYFSSGLYKDSFYKLHELDFCSDHSLIEKVEFNRELLAEHDEDRYESVYDEENDCDKWEQVENQFWEAVSMRRICYEPLIFDEEIALECGLTPFTFDGKNMLALSSYGMDFTPRLDAYQALVHGTVDQCSKLLSGGGREYFDHVVGNDIAQRALEAVTMDACA